LNCLLAAAYSKTQRRYPCLSVVLCFVLGNFQKSPAKFVDRRGWRRYRCVQPVRSPDQTAGGGVLNLLQMGSQKRLAMFGKLKKDKLPLKIELFTIRWYSSNRSCAKTSHQRLNSRQMPPLMVRKAEWRR
jgi:hypothetical protein